MYTKLKIYCNNIPSSRRCNASGLNSHWLSKAAMLTVNEEDELALTTPTFIAAPRSQVVIEGQTVTLDCAANGVPKPIIKWLKDGYTIDLA